MNNTKGYDEMLLLSKVDEAIKALENSINRIKTEHPEDEVVYKDGFRPLDKLEELRGKMLAFRDRLVTGEYSNKLDVVVQQLGGIDSPYYQKICSNDVQYLDYVIYAASSLYGDENGYTYSRSDAENIIDNYEKNQEELMNGTIKKFDDDAKARIKDIDVEIEYLNYEKNKFFLFRHGSKKSLDERIATLTKEKNNLIETINNRI